MCRVTITPKSYIFTLYDILDEQLKNLRAQYPGKTDEYYHGKMQNKAKENHILFYRRGLTIAVCLFFYCLVHLKNRVISCLWCMALAHQHKYNGYRPTAELLQIIKLVPSLKTTVNGIIANVKEVKETRSASFQTIGRQSDKLLDASPSLIYLLSNKVKNNVLLTKYLCVIYVMMYYMYLMIKLCELFNPTKQQILQLQMVTTWD